MWHALLEMYIFVFLCAKTGACSRTSCSVKPREIRVCQRLQLIGSALFTSHVTPFPFIITLCSSSDSVSVPLLHFFPLYDLEPVIISICVLPTPHAKTLCYMCCTLIRHIITQKTCRLTVER